MKKKSRMPNIPELLGKIPEYQKRAELHDEITVKILELVNENNERIAQIEKYMLRIMEREIKE